MEMHHPQLCSWLPQDPQFWTLRREREKIYEAAMATTNRLATTKNTTNKTSFTLHSEGSDFDFLVQCNLKILVLSQKLIATMALKNRCYYARAVPWESKP